MVVLNSAWEICPEKRKNVAHIRVAAGVLKVSDEVMWAETSSSLPFSSETYLGNAVDKPKSASRLISDPMRVTAARIPISCWVTDLASKAKPTTPISVERMLCKVRCTEPDATFEASTVFSVLASLFL